MSTSSASAPPPSDTNPVGQVPLQNSTRQQQSGTGPQGQTMVGPLVGLQPLPSSSSNQGPQVTQPTSGPLQVQVQPQQTGGGNSGTIVKTIIIVAIILAGLVAAIGFSIYAPDGLGLSWGSLGSISQSTGFHIGMISGAGFLLSIALYAILCCTSCAKNKGHQGVLQPNSTQNQPLGGNQPQPQLLRG